MTKKQKKRRNRIVCGALLFILAVCTEHFGVIKDHNIQVILFLASYLVTGRDVIKKAVRNIKNGQIFDENFLMLIASLGAFLINETSEAAGVMLFYEIGEFFQDYAVNRSRKSIASLMDIRPDSANLKKDDATVEVSPGEVKEGDIIVIKPGERVPLDGIIVKGESLVDTMAITGESVPRTVRAGDDIISGCIVKDGVLEAKVTKTFSESTVSRILELVENASSRKAESENFITRFARYYTPAVVACAVCLAVIPSLLVGNPSVWIYRALSFLVISCPCALVISIPLSFFGGIGGASSKGILVKGSNYLEALASADTVVFDKTGTLTKGVFEVSDLVPSESFALESGSREEAKSGLLKLASLAESYSNHPIALSITDAAKERGIYDSEAAAKIEPDNIKELSGRGISAVINGDTVLCGNRKLMDSEKVNMEKADEYSGEGTCVFLAYSGKYAGRIIISDEIRPDSVKCIKGLKDLSITAVMLTGDRKRSADAVSEKLGIDMVYSELLPSDKVDITEKLLDKEQNGNKLAFVGDGINDAPVLARADIGVAMGGVGSDAAIEASDIVLMTDEPSKLIEAVKISKKTLRIVKENIVFAIGVKVLILILAAFGIASMWAAVFADVGVAVIAILNAMRAMRV